MSGPKTQYVSLSSEAQRRLEQQRKSEALKAACSHIIQKIEVQSEECQELRREISLMDGNVREERIAVSVRHPDSLAELESYHRELSRVLERVGQEKRRLNGEMLSLIWEREVLKKVRGSMGTLDLSAVRIDGGNAPSASQPSASDAHQVYEEGVDAVLEAISGIEESGQRNRFVAMLKEAQAHDDARTRKREILNVKTEVLNALDVQDLRAIATRELEAIAHLTTPAALRARDCLNRVSDAMSLSAFRVLVAEAVEDERKAQERSYIENALRESLETLGYSVGDGFFATDFGDVVLAQTESAPHHAIRIQYSPESNRIFSRVVSDGETNAAEDEMAEVRSCSAILEATGRLSKVGATVQLQSERKPGEVPVEVASDLRGGRFGIRRQRDAIRKNTQVRGA